MTHDAHLPHRPPHGRAHRRAFLRHGAGLAAVGLGAWRVPAASAATPAPATDTRTLRLVHLHTGEELRVAYARGSAYLDDAMARVNHFLRDHYSGEVGRIDPGVLDQLHRLQVLVGSTQPYEVISGFRGEVTNERLRRQGGGGVARRSLHMDGRAVDVRLPGTALAELRDAALSLQAGGVGYYAQSRFVHLDTGRVRRW